MVSALPMIEMPGGRIENAALPKRIVGAGSYSEINPCGFVTYAFGV